MSQSLPKVEKERQKILREIGQEPTATTSPSQKQWTGLSAFAIESVNRCSGTHDILHNMVFFWLAALVLAPANREAQLSAAVAIVSEGVPMARFLDHPGRSVLEAHFRFADDLGDDVVFGIDQEFIEGVRRPLYVRAGDWMGLVGLQRTGVVYIAVGTPETMKGQPSKDRTWVVRTLDRPLRPNIWYRMLTEVDFSRREFVMMKVEGDGWSRQLPLTGLTLDFPNEMPFSDRTMGYFVFAMRSRSMMTTGGAARVAFDDVRAWSVDAAGKRVQVFSCGFETDERVLPQPVTLPVIDLKRYRQGAWYLEREEARVAIERAPWARSGTRVMMTDARLD